MLLQKPLRFDVLADGTSVVSERDVVRPDGTSVCIEMHSKQMNNGWYQSFVLDVSDRKRLEVRLRESEERLMNLFERAPLGYQSLDADGRFLEVNEAWIATLGYSRDDVIGKNSKI